MVEFNGFQHDITIKNADIPPAFIAPQDNTKIAINFKEPIINFNQTANALKKMKENISISNEEFNYLILKNAVETALPDASEKFIQQISEMAKKLKCDELDVAALLFKESQFKPTAGNCSFKGLGQMNRAALTLSIKYAKENPEENEGIDPNMTLEKFTKLSREKQMPYVKNYALKMKEQYLGKDKQMSGGDLYALFLTPGYAKKFVILNGKSKNTSVRKMYTSNRGLDKIDNQNREIQDGQITKKDLQFTLDSIKTDVFKVDKSVKKQSFDRKS